MNTDNPKSPEQQAKEAAETEYPIWPNKFKDKDEWLPEDITKREQKAFVKGWNAHAEHMRDTQQGGEEEYKFYPNFDPKKLQQVYPPTQSVKEEPQPVQQGREWTDEQVGDFLEWVEYNCKMDLQPGWIYKGNIYPLWDLVQQYKSSKENKHKP